MEMRLRKTELATRYSKQAVLAFVITALSIAATAVGQQASASPHQVRTTKFTVDSVVKNTAFYEEMLGMTEMNRFLGR